MPDEDTPARRTGSSEGTDSSMSSEPSGAEESDTARLSMGRETAIALLAKLFLTATGFLGFVYFGQTLGPAGIGLYYFVLAVAKFLVQGIGGVSNALKKRVAEVETDVERYLGLGLIVLLSFTGLLFIGVYLLEGIIRTELGPVRYAYGGVAIV